MDFLEDYPNLEPAQKERFQQIVTRLLSGEVLTPGPALKPDPDWRFVERFREIVDSYLRFGGWRLDIDLDGFPHNSVMLMKHVEPPGSQSATGAGSSSTTL